MINETINATVLNFDNVVKITSSTPMIIAYALVWFIPLFIYFLWGALASAKTADGRKLKSLVIQNANFWIGFLIFGIIELGLIILIIFPVWLIPLYG
jgi:hypothetical protein